MAQPTTPGKKKPKQPGGRHGGGVLRIGDPPQFGVLLRRALATFTKGSPASSFFGAVTGPARNRRRQLEVDGARMSLRTWNRLVSGQADTVEAAGGQWIRNLATATGGNDAKGILYLLEVPALRARLARYEQEAAALLARVRSRVEAGTIGLTKSPLWREAVTKLRKDYGGKASDAALMLAEVRLMMPFALAGRDGLRFVERGWAELAHGEKRQYLAAWRKQQDILLNRPRDLQHLAKTAAEASARPGSRDYEEPGWGWARTFSEWEDEESPPDWMADADD